MGLQQRLSNVESRISTSVLLTDSFNVSNDKLNTDNDCLYSVVGKLSSLVDSSLFDVNRYGLGKRHTLAYMNKMGKESEKT